MHTMERRQVIESIRAAVAGFYTPEESRVVAYEIAARFCGFSRLEAISDPAADVVCDLGLLDEKCRQLAQGCPLQYVTGFTEFCGLRLAVSEGTLIPRPETEELVAWIIEEYAGCEGLRFLDIGTGSGAIAIALAHLLPEAVAEAVDISPAALKIASSNVADNLVQVRFAEADILGDAHAFRSALRSDGYEVVVSNPPYIPASEYADMRDNVRRYEPYEALFVPDSDPLLFYRKIGERAAELLVSGGKLFVEIHENFSEAVCGVLSAAGFMDVTCRNDINDKPRMIRGTKR